MRDRPHNRRDASSGSAMDASMNFREKPQNGQRSTVFEDAQWCSARCHFGAMTSASCLLDNNTVAEHVVQGLLQRA
jgi:hypothetical protein